MNNLLARFLTIVLALFVASEIVPGIHIEGLYTAIIVAIVLGILNAIVRPVLFIITLPITVLTLGLFIFVLNASIFWFVATFIKGFEVTGFFPALLGALIVSGASWLVNTITK
jgi:putative membrane protein